MTTTDGWGRLAQVNKEACVIPATAYRSIPADVDQQLPRYSRRRVRSEHGERHSEPYVSLNDAVFEPSDDTDAAGVYAPVRGGLPPLAAAGWNVPRGVVATDASALRAASCVFRGGGVLCCSLLYVVNR
jgi:hypothetical protein